MVSYLITDTHFGYRQASPSFFESQMKFMKTFLKLLKKKPGRVFHLGDVFHSREFVPVKIGEEVRKLFNEIEKVATEFYIISGNHDIYSPVSDDYTSIEMVLDQPVIVREVVELDDCILVPWSKTGEIEGLYSKGKPILTHTDLLSMNMPKVPVISGHLHQRFFEGNKINLGSCFAFNFGDGQASCSADGLASRFVDSPGKYIYTTEDFKTFTSIENTDSIRFLRVTPDTLNQARPGDELELYIQRSELTKSVEDYIKSLPNKIKIIYVQEQVTFSSCHCDIYSIIDGCIPDHLKTIYDETKEITKSSLHR